MERFWVGDIYMLGRGRTPWEQKLLCLCWEPFQTLPYVSPHLLFLYIVYKPNKLGNESKCFSEQMTECRRGFEDLPLTAPVTSRATPAGKATAVRDPGALFSALSPEV